MTVNVKKAIEKIYHNDIFDEELYFVGGTKLQDENVTALRMAGLFPDEYMIKFVLDDVKLEFYNAPKNQDNFYNNWTQISGELTNFIVS